MSESGLINQLKKLENTHGKEKAVRYLVVADALVHCEIRERANNSPDSWTGFSRYYPAAYLRLKEAIKDLGTLDSKLRDLSGCEAGRIPSESLAYVITQFAKREGKTLEDAFDKLIDVGASLSLTNGRDNDPMYKRIFVLFRDMVGLFPDGTGSLDADENYRR